MEINTFFIIHEDDSAVKTYKLKVTDKPKCTIMLEKYSEICYINKTEEIVEYTTGLVNIFLGNKDSWYQELMQKYITIDLSSNIAYLEEVKCSEINFGCNFLFLLKFIS